MIVYQHPFMDIEWEPERSILYFYWKEETEFMTNHEFEYTICRYASFVKEYNAKNVMIMMQNFRGKPEQSGLDYVGSVIRDIYNDAGIERKCMVPVPETRVIHEPGADFRFIMAPTVDEALQA